MALYGGGIPQGWVPDPNRAGGVRPWDPQGFDPTQGGVGQFYRPGPDAGGGAPGGMPGVPGTPGNGGGIVPGGPPVRGVRGMGGGMQGGVSFNGAQGSSFGGGGFQGGPTQMGGGGGQRNPNWNDWGSLYGQQQPGIGQDASGNTGIGTPGIGQDQSSMQGALGGMQGSQQGGMWGALSPLMNHPTIGPMLQQFMQQQGGQQGGMNGLGSPGQGFQQPGQGFQQPGQQLTLGGLARMRTMNPNRNQGY